MPSGDSYQDGEENGSPDPSGVERGVPVERANREAEPAGRGGMASGSGSGSGEDEEVDEQAEGRRVAEESRGEPSGVERGQEDVEMNGGHDSIGGTRRHSSSANGSPGSTTGSGSTKSSKSVTGSSSCSLHSTACSQSRHHADCSEQAEQGRDHSHREMMQTVQEMKKRLPSEKRSRSKPSTVEALNYALNCVKQVQANSEYYKLLMCNGLEERKDATVCSLEQLESITSEHTLKNTDTFVVVFSLATGRVVYASEQASSILNCKRKFLDSAKFVELLFHQDVNVFYSHTAQPHLPPWNVGTDSAAVLFECAQVKSFFCRIRGGKDRDGEMRYNPFRITPYLLKVQGMGGEEEHPCCLALAERIISGYEAPRIPTDKRIFTTTHSPGCVFLEVDDRAVPLLGYLPQDLIGTSVLTCLHPEDRTLMLAMHRKILKYAGQPPFEHSPIRFRCQNGDYVTLDTSWSSFVNPWSRKVAFIIGRHKVRTGPLNEDVFAAQSKAELPVMNEDVKELQAMIYKLFLQPVHNNGSSGYGSLGSNGSHEHYISVASSSDSNGNLWEDSHREPVTLQQICANVNKVKRGGQQAYLDSRRKVMAEGKVSTETPAPILQGGQRLEIQRLRRSLEDSHRKQPHIPSYQQINCVDSIIRYLESCSGPALKRKSESLSIATSSSSTTSEEDKTPAAPLEDRTNADEATMEASAGLESQVSAGSAVTVAHTTAAVVGAPLTDITLSTKAMSVVSVTSQCSYSSTIVHVPQPESEVTALEDAPMGSEPADPAPAPSRPAPTSSTTAPEEFQVVGLTKEVLSAHTQKEEQEYVDRFRHRILESPYSSYLQQDNSSMAHSNHRGDYAMRPLSTRDWNRSHSGKPRHKRAKPQASSDSDGSRPGHFLPMTSSAPNNSSSESSQPKPNFFSPMLMPVQPPYYPVPPQPTVMQPHGVPMVVQPEQTQPVMQVMNPFMSPVMAVIMPYPANYTIYPQAVPGMPGVPGVQSVTQPGLVPPSYPHPSFMSLVDNPPAQSGPSSMPPAPGALLSSPISSPWPEEDVDGAQPTVLFSSSRSSSPLQLNLLQEELPKPNAPQSNTGRAESLHEQHAKEDSPSDSGNQDAQSTSRVLLDLLLHEDARSGTGSNASGSGSGESGGSLGSGSGLGSNGTSTSHTGSSNSSKYFASNDSSDTSHKARKSQDAPERSSFDKCVEDSLWTMIQHTPEPVMMTYQIHPRDQAQVLKEDREKLLLLQPMQPWFTQEQKEELAEVHSWIHHHSVPEEINTQGCVSCIPTALEGGDAAAHSPSLPTPDSSTNQDRPAEDVSPASDT
ncbi:period circadian protein homolog 3 [Pangasianodon hypophthalmus]|uniref:period circadian protein homolog 3 n=1 Tax=Pangasianodon hypophthalmus TaxID=310915 RepID=UPI0023071530|nr:period circadian protein homolog 3 [Pangasianodon hypophthalmus]XP_034170032.2 period circadian protein homolog 3 [Pangasianodon hypophthalmus]